MPIFTTFAKQNQSLINLIINIRNTNLTGWHFDTVGFTRSVKFS